MTTVTGPTELLRAESIFHVPEKSTLAWACEAGWRKVAARNTATRKLFMNPP
jgi:hypothetical protein